MARIDLTLRIVLADPPEGVVFSLQDARSRPVDPAMADGGDLSFDVAIALTDTPDGPRPGGGFVRSDGRGRFVYIASGRQAGQHSDWSRRIKVYLHDLPAAEAGAVLTATIAGRDKDGGPACATIPLLSGWRRI
ncbi:DUF5990 family protein [Caulobacter sp. BK020]|uniref:DUF5990 family protein n=1 Tax=Caulobacter sp. BK020 TaxID=2512117 RepID=UPI00104CD58E|nr:DUF5990 family protein [Caulobacter sp. BK020]TCS12854.1 hypothetical protein EV278_11149 [Caulobacter sp. BK020]